MPARTHIRISSVASLALVGMLCFTGVTASADEVPSRQDVADARAAANGAADDVAGIQAQLALANQRAQEAWIASAEAGERYNGARVAAAEARRKAGKAARRVQASEAKAAVQRVGYGNALVDEFQSGGGLRNVSSLLQADGVNQAQQRMGTWRNYTDALDAKHVRWSASATVASIGRDQARRASREAAELADRADRAKESAESAAAAANAEVDSIASERAELIQRLARLQKVSVQVATERQDALEARAALAAAEAAQREAEDAAAAQAAADAADAASQDTGTEPEEQPAAEPTRPADGAADEPVDQEPSAEPTSEPSDEPTNEPASEPSEEPSREPSDEPTEEPADEPANDSDADQIERPVTPEPTEPAEPSTPNRPVEPAPPATGADAAIAFAKAQLGEPYVWAAAGPSAWDCSGLTMQAWAAGGKSLPHWSVGQYRATTPITLGQLQPGDLMFWGSSPGSIYHVALYLGGGQMIHAPRPGKGVTIESMYYWRTPNFFTRP